MSHRLGAGPPDVAGVAVRLTAKPGLLRVSVHDFSSQRLYVDDPLAGGAPVALAGPQAHYLRTVLRLREGDAVLLFNGRDGEWRATLTRCGKRDCTLMVSNLIRPQSDGPDVLYLFAPLKHARLDYMVQKATELGVRQLQPILTRRTVAERVNLDRMRANVIEAAEQCGILQVPTVCEPLPLPKALESLETSRRLIVCDEDAPSASPVAALSALEPGPIAVAVGPEGGFDDTERERLKSRPGAILISLGPRIMRADTAAVAALALVNATIGQGW